MRHRVVKILFSGLLFLGAVIILFDHVKAEENKTPSPFLIEADCYCAFLNSDAGADYADLFNDQMAGHVPSAFLKRFGVPGSYHYETIPGKEKTALPYLNKKAVIQYSEWKEQALLSHTLASCSTDAEVTTFHTAHDEKALKIDEARQVKKLDSHFKSCTASVVEKNELFGVDPALKSNGLFFASISQDANTFFDDVFCNDLRCHEKATIGVLAVWVIAGCAIVINNEVQHKREIIRQNDMLRIDRGLNPHSS